VRYVIRLNSSEMTFATVWTGVKLSGATSATKLGFRGPTSFVPVIPFVASVRWCWTKPYKILSTGVVACLNEGGISQT
jgi:hypothetical protein